MQRLSITLAVIAALFAGGFATILLRPMPATLNDGQVKTIVSQMLAADKANTPAPPPAGPDEQRVRAIVADLLAADHAANPLPSPGPDEDKVRGIVTDLLAEDRANNPPQVAQIDSATLDPLIETYLLNNPGILDEVTAKRDEQNRVAAREQEKAILLAQHDAIYKGKGDVILGNPNGDVTLVEMFDYNCTYCRGALPDLAQLIADDPNLKVILKEFPILSQGSIEAARVAVLVAQDPKINYWDFHEQLFATRGQVGVEQALDVAEKLGGDRVSLMLDMNGGLPQDVIAGNYALAKAIHASGTPTYILGDEMIPGAVGIDRLRNGISNIRACGSVECTGSNAG